jgi:hypothetical protein
MLVNKALLCIFLSILLVALSFLPTTIIPHPANEMIKFFVAPLLIGLASSGINKKKSFNFVIVFCLAVIALKHLILTSRLLLLLSGPDEIIYYGKISMGVFCTIGLIEFMASFIGALIGLNIYNFRQKRNSNPRIR